MRNRLVSSLLTRTIIFGPACSDGTGTIDKEEFRSVIREMGNPMAAQDIEKAFFTVDTDNRSVPLVHRCFCSCVRDSRCCGSGQLEFNEFKDWFLRMEQDHAPIGPARSVLKLGLLLKRTFVTNLFQVDIRRLARRRIVTQRRGMMVYQERGLYRQREPPYLHFTHTTACKYACPTCLRGFTSAGFLARHVDRGTCTIYDTLTLGLREDATANAVGAAVSGLNPRNFMPPTKTGDDDGANAADEVGAV